MLLDFSLPQVPATSVKANNNLDMNSILGLTPSNYEGLQKVGNTDYFYGNNRMYEAYTPPPPTNYGGYYGIMGYSRPSNNTGLYGYQPAPKPSHESITIDGQEFRTVSPDIQGFSKEALDSDKYQKDSVYKYSPSMAYVYANNPNKYTPPAVTPNLFNLPMPDVAMNSYEGGHGAGRFLNGGVLGFDFGQSIGQEASE